LPENSARVSNYRDFSDGFENKHILVVTPRFHPLVGGQEIQAERVANLLTSKGAITTVLTERIYENHLNQQKEFSFNTVFLHNRWATPFPRLTMFVKCFKYYLKNAKKFDIIIVRTFSVYSLSLGLYKRFNRSSFKSLVLTDSTTEVPAVSGSRFSVLFRFMLMGNDYINAISPEVSCQLIDFGVKPESITHIPNLFEVSQVPDYVTVNEPCRRFVYVGNIARDKGVFDLAFGFAKACNELEDISLDIYGVGIDFEKLSHLIIELGITNYVRLHGVIPNEDLGRVLKLYDCLIYPSHKEGFGLVPFEAAAIPMKIIVTRVGVLEKYLNERCLFIDTNDPRALCSSIRLACEAPAAANIMSNVSWKKHLNQETVLIEIASVLLRE
jgi:glycosyltransferase involved in cell wall biosynthesis